MGIAAAVLSYLPHWRRTLLTVVSAGTHEAPRNEGSGIVTLSRPAVGGTAPMTGGSSRNWLAIIRCGVDAGRRRHRFTTAGRKPLRRRPLAAGTALLLVRSSISATGSRPRRWRQRIRPLFIHTARPAGNADGPDYDYASDSLAGAEPCATWRRRGVGCGTRCCMCGGHGCRTVAPAAYTLHCPTARRLCT